MWSGALRSFLDMVTAQVSLVSSLRQHRSAQNGRATCTDRTGLYVRCSKLLRKAELSTGPYVLMNRRLSGFCVRFDGTLGAPFLYIPVVAVRKPVVGPS